MLWKARQMTHQRELRAILVCAIGQANKTVRPEAWANMGDTPGTASGLIRRRRALALPEFPF